MERVEAGREEFDGGGEGVSVVDLEDFYGGFYVWRQGELGSGVEGYGGEG